MPACPRRRPLMLALAVATVTPALLATAAQAATYTFINPSGGRLDESTNYSPTGIPGAADTLRIDALPTIPGFLELRVGTNQTIGRIEFNHFAPATINSDFDGTNAPFILTLATGQLAFTNAVSESPDVPLDTLFLNATVAGGAGLTKTGPGFVSLSADNTYTGTTTIDGAGGLSVGKDSALGAASNTLFINNDGTLRAVSSFATSRSIAFGASGGRIESYGTLTLNGPVSGTNSMTVGRFTGGTVSLNNASSTFSGSLIIAQANTVDLLGRLGSVGSIRLGGTLNIGVGTVGPAVDAIRDAAGINSLGGSLNIVAGSSNTTETLGLLTLTAGTTNINLQPSFNGGTQLAFASLLRANRSTAFVTGRDLGNGSLVSNRALVTFADTSGLPLVGSAAAGGTGIAIVPFIFGNASANGDPQARAVEAGLVTRTVNGLRVLDASNYATNPLTNAATDNVRVTDTAFSVNSARTMNALVVRDTLNSAAPSGISGTGMLTITSGAILGVTDLAGEELFINNPINFGAAEGVIHTAVSADGSSQLTLRGPISGTNGLTKSGVGNLFLENTASTYSGLTTVNAGLAIYSGDINVNAPCAFGNSTSELIINAGVTGDQYVGVLAATTGSTFARNIIVRQDESANSLAIIGTYGGYGATYSGAISIEGGFLNLLGPFDPSSPQQLTLSGSVLSRGGLQEPQTAFPQQQYIRLTGNNGYLGGTIIRSGRWEVGSNTALGTGTVYFVGNNDPGSEQTGAIAAIGGARTLGNAFVFRESPLFTGTEALTLTGGIDLGSVPRTVRVDSSADVTFAGVVSRGGLVKTGPGRLVLGGANTFNGQAIISAGTLRIANNSALGEATGATRPGQATFITGAGTLELAGGISTAETIYFGSADAPITAGTPTGNLRNVSGNNIISGQVGLDNVSTVGVDAGTQLTLTGDGIDITTGGNATLRKVGAGLLAVRNVRLPSLAIDEGTVRVSPAGAPLGTSRVSSLAIDADGTLDLTNNAFVLDYTTTSPINDIRTLLANGRIITSVSQPGARVGYANASTLFAAGAFPVSFAGQAIDNTTLLMLQTLGGDTNLDRTVNFADLVSLAQNYNTGPTQVWRNGDFNYDGTVNFGDLVLLAQNYNQTASGAIIAAEFGSAFAADWALAQSVVPEPATLALFALAIPLVRRRR